MKPALPAPKPEARRAQPRPNARLSPRTGSVEQGERPPAKWALVGVLLAVVAAVSFEHPPAREAIAKGVQLLRTELASFKRRTESAARQAEAVRPEATPSTGSGEAPVVADLKDRLLESAASLAAGPLRELSDLSSEGMQAGLGPDGRVLLTSKYRVLSLGAGDANDRRTLFSPEMYRAQFPDGRMQAMASALMLPGGCYLLGGWHGEVLLGSDSELRQLSTREQRPKGRIADLRAWGDAVLLAGDGLWRLRSDGSGLEELRLPTRRRLAALGVQGDQVLIAEDGRRIHRWTGASAEPWLELPREDARVEALAAATGGGWWIASTRGLYRADREGQVQELLLDGVWISAVLERADELWVGSWKQGLLLRRNARWYRLGEGFGGLAAASVSGIAVDSADHAWLSLYGGGAWHAPLAVLREALLKQPWTPVAELQP